MITTIGFLELNSIALGIAAADDMLKAADVELLFARPNCPGKYNILISGEVAAVDAAMAAGAARGGANVLQTLVIPRIHPSVILAVQAAGQPFEKAAIGVLEFFTITGAVLAGDKAVKAAEVQLLDIRLGTGIGGKSFVVLGGETAAVEQAVAVAGAEATGEGTLIGSVVIPNPDPRLYDNLL